MARGHLQPVPIPDTSFEDYDRAHYHGHVTHTCLVELARATLRAQLSAGDTEGAARTRASIKALEASRTIRRRQRRGLGF